MNGLVQLLDRLQAQDAEALKRWLDESATTRDRWMRQKLEELNPD